MREERIEIGGREIVVSRPESAESLIDEARFAEDEFLPYWAELWPSGLALARHVSALDLTGARVLELGCGLALPSLAAAQAGAVVLATDWAPEALDLVRVNAAANGLHVETMLFEWGSPLTPWPAPHDLVLAADVLYEERNTQPLLAALDRAVTGAGTVLLADPGRRHAPAFFAEAGARGWLIEMLATADLPSGAIARLSR